jgi:hypothetical protein
VTPIGLYMGPTLDTLNPRHATAVVAPLIEIYPTDSVDYLVDQTASSLQFAIDCAQLIHHQN